MVFNACPMWLSASTGAVVEPPKAFWLVTEYLIGGTLAKWIHGGRRSVSEKLNMAIGIAKGMQASRAFLQQIANMSIMIWV